MEYFDIQGNQISKAKFTQLFEERAHIRFDETLDHIVSTVWLGTSRGEKDGKPLIFETIAFCRSADFRYTECRRYTSMEDAIKGHSELLKKYRSK